jgi:hypothetical protein
MAQQRSALRPWGRMSSKRLQMKPNAIDILEVASNFPRRPRSMILKPN